MKRRTMGVHLTSSETFETYIYPEIEDKLNEYLWIDLYAGEGNLIFPILENIPKEKREGFFKEHIFLSDIQEKMVQKCIETATSYGISEELAQKNIKNRNNLESFPKFLKEKKLPLYHITNPPYLYLGYIRKHEETKKHLKYFVDQNEGYQDLYQIAMINDLRNNVKNLVYIIPTNFLFGSAVSNKFRLDFLKYYNIEKMFIFEKKIFEFTGTNILIGFFKKKKEPSHEPAKFKAYKFKKNNKIIEREYHLKFEYKYRAGSEFNIFIDKFKAKKPLKVSYYLTIGDVEENRGEREIQVIDTSEYESNQYNQKLLKVNEKLKSKIQSNILYVRTVDTGSYKGRVGLYNIRDDFDVDGIFVSGNTYRTSPIQIFLEPAISLEKQNLLRKYFNVILEHFRDKLDSEFLTTYKYSSADYTRKYLGLTQTRSIIKTFPILSMENGKNMTQLREYIKEKEVNNLLKFIKQYSKKAVKESSRITNWF
ncbi:MAG: N-6 DNA methylase [Candidatus Lokiarchaeota archaeon]|nr:N-6 DNA methylase [Candidatus Lokiarchaeota archaeon]